MEKTAINDALQKVQAGLSTVILGKEEQIKLALTCLLAKGHLLIEDVPGLGKTVLAHALGKTLGLEYQRLQFTSDLLPGDIIGSSIYDRENSRFHFTPGPVFTQLLLADEINRATPKCQSALLEAMEEDRRKMIEKLEPLLTTEILIELQDEAEKVIVSDAALEYLYRLVECTRTSDLFQTGLSTRAGLGLLRAAQAWALLHGEEKLLPGDIQRVLPSVAAHRLVPVGGRMPAERIGREILEQIEVEA